MSETYPGSRTWKIADLMAEGEERSRLEQENALLREDNKRLRAEMQRREELAYEYGLGSAATVYRHNKILTAAITALTDPMHVSMIRP